MKKNKGTCTICGEHKWLVNSKNRCANCQRLKNRGELENKTLFKQHPKRITKYSRQSVLEKDRELYKEVFNKTLNQCENCSKPLKSDFEDRDGNIIDIWQYSHILSKGAYPKLRHEVENINRLCFNCHQQWEFGKREEMNIYPKNQKTIEKLLEKINK